jgi:hypothetical protein
MGHGDDDVNVGLVEGVKSIELSATSYGIHGHWYKEGRFVLELLKWLEELSSTFCLFATVIFMIRWCFGSRCNQ